MRIRSIILALLILGLPSGAVSEIYKWTDAEDKLWFTDDLGAVPFEQRWNMETVKEILAPSAPSVDRWSLARRADQTLESSKTSYQRGVYVKPDKSEDGDKKSSVDERGRLRRSKAYYLPSSRLGPNFSPPTPQNFQREIQVREQIIHNLVEKLQPSRQPRQISPSSSMGPAPQGMQAK